MGLGGEVSLNLEILRRGGAHRQVLEIRVEWGLTTLCLPFGGGGGRDVDFSGITQPTQADSARGV